MITKYTLKMPQIIYSGRNALENINSIINMEIKKAAVFTDKGIVKAGLLKVPLSYLNRLDVAYEVIDDLPTEPTYDEAQKAVERFKAMDADLIIAVGGGSVMDIAKLASVLKTDNYSVRDLIDNPLMAVKCVKTLMIPTTAGTGSEATPNSIVLIPEKELKVGIVNEKMIADYVILDAEMIKRLPKKIAAATGVDALAHAIECYTSKKANPFSDMFALEALELIFQNIEKAYNDPEAAEAKNSMLLASFYAGVAITASGTTAVHALSYPLGGRYHISHGVANAMLLVPVMKFNEPECRDLFANIYDRINTGQEEKTEALKSSWIIKRLDEIVKNLEIPTNLNEFMVPGEDLEVLVESGMQVKRLLDNNRREVTPEDARAIYQQLF